MIAAVEDALSEAVVRRMISTVRPDLIVTGVLRKNGRGYIQSRANELNRTARSLPVFVLADLDRPVPCPADLIASWLSSRPAANLLFRMAVMEIESWVMADRDAFSEFLGVPVHRIPLDTDAVLQPKELIVSFARLSKWKDIRRDLVPLYGATSTVGPGFNARVMAFVNSDWDAERASAASHSLRRAIERLQTAFQ